MEKRFIIGALRRLSLRMPERTLVRKNAKVARNSYKCEICEELFTSKEIEVHHKIPVIDKEVGFENWDIYIQRLFCEVENLQVLCKPCHKKQ